MPSGQAVTNFSLATNYHYTNSQTNEKVSETTWWKIAVWGKMAENCNQYLSKGSKVFVEGMMTPDKANGQSSHVFAPRWYYKRIIRS